MFILYMYVLLWEVVVTCQSEGSSSMHAVWKGSVHTFRVDLGMLNQPLISFLMVLTGTFLFLSQHDSPNVGVIIIYTCICG